MEPHKEKFKIITSQTDANNRLTPETLASFFQEAALYNVRKLGVSHTSLFEQDLGWILLRLRIEWEQIPGQGETIEIRTWPSGNDRLYFYRDYRIYNEAGEFLAKATSTWVLVNISTRKILPIPEFLSKLSIECEPPMERISKKLPVYKEEAKVFNLQVGWQDLDLFKHTNNPVYLRWIMESLPDEVLEKESIKAIDISYRAESKLGEMLEVSSGKLDDGSFAVKIVRPADGKELLRANVKTR